MNREEAWEQVELNCPNLNYDQQLALVNLLAGLRAPRRKKEGQRMYIGSQSMVISARAGKLGKRQKIFESNQWSARKWREGEAKLRNDTTYLEGKEEEKRARKEALSTYLSENLNRYKTREQEMMVDALRAKIRASRNKVFGNKNDEENEK